MCQHVLHFVVVVEQAIAVQPLNAALFDLHGRRHKAIRADDLQILLIPQDQVQIIIVVAVGVPAFAAPFLHRAKGNLAQAAQLPQQRGVFLAVALPKIDGFPVAGFAQRFGLRQRALQSGPVFRTGNRALGFKDAGHSLAKTHHVLTALLGHLTRRKGGAVPVMPRNLLADFNRQLAVAAAEHLLHQQQHRQRRGDQRAGVKEQAVVRLNMHRQQRDAQLAGEFDKARVPFLIANAFARGAGNFACREEDQYARVLQVLFHLHQRRLRRPAAHIVHRNKQRAEGLKVGQHPVGHDFNVAPHAGDGVQQRQTVQRTRRVVGNDDQRAMFGDLFEIAGGNGAENIQVFQNLLHHIQSFQVAVGGGKLLKLVFVEQSF